VEDLLVLIERGEGGALFLVDYAVSTERRIPTNNTIGNIVRPFMADTFIPKNYVNKFFAAWDAVPRIPKNKSSRIAFKQSVVQRPIDKRSFLEAMQEMIDIFGAYFLGMMEKNTTVAEIFHLRVKIRKTVTTEEEIKHYTVR